MRIAALISMVFTANLVAVRLKFTRRVVRPLKSLEQNQGQTGVLDIAQIFLSMAKNTHFIMIKCLSWRSREPLLRPDSKPSLSARHWSFMPIPAEAPHLISSLNLPLLETK